MTENKTEESKGMKAAKKIGDIVFGIGVVFWGLIGFILSICIIPGLIFGIIGGILAIMGAAGAFMAAVICAQLMPSHGKIVLEAEVKKRKKEAEKEARILKAMEE